MPGNKWWLSVDFLYIVTAVYVGECENVESRTVSGKKQCCLWSAL